MSWLAIAARRPPDGSRGAGRHAGAARRGVWHVDADGADLPAEPGGSDAADAPGVRGQDGVLRRVRGAVCLASLVVRSVPFMVSFTSAISSCLHLMEALCLRRLFAGAPEHDGVVPRLVFRRRNTRSLDARRPTPRPRGSTRRRPSSGTSRTAGSTIRSIHLPKVFGIDFSVTKHVFMLWVVAAIVFVVVTVTVRRYLRQDRHVPSGFMNGLEAVVEFIRDSIVLPNVGRKWVNTWTPLVLTFFVFILCANAIGLIPDLRRSRPHRSLRAPHRRGVVRASSCCTAARPRPPTST